MSQERTLSGPLNGLGEALWTLRAQAHLTQNELSTRAGVTRGLVGAYETGTTVPNLDSLEKLLKTLKVDRFGFANALRAVQGLPAVAFETVPRSSRPENPLATLLDIKLSAAAEAQLLQAVTELRDWFLSTRGVPKPEAPKVEEEPPPPSRRKRRRKR
jgi:transcriptional regulator with XRE-family HTH domain